MAIYGSAAAGTGVANCENAINWFAFTVGAAGETPATADVWLNESTTTNAHTWKVVLHRASDGVFIAETSARSDIITGGPASYQFTFSTSPSLSAVEYRAGVFANSAGGNANVIKNDGVGGARYNQTALTYPTVPDPATFTEVEASAQLRMTVTTNDPSSGQANVFTGKFGRPLIGKL